MKITRPSKTVRVVIDHDAHAAYEAAQNALAHAVVTATEQLTAPEDDRLGARPTEDRRITAARAARDTARENLAPAVVTFTIRGLPRPVWNAVLAKHPAGKNASPTDKEFGANVEAFVADLLTTTPSIETVVDGTGTPVPFDPATDWPGFSAELTSAQWQEFWTALLDVNRGLVSVPFFKPASESSPA